MGHVTKTPAGTFRANWRDPAGRQKAKTFKTKRAASAFLTDIEGAMNRGAYVDPTAGRIRFGEFAARWLDARSVEATTLAAWSSRLRARIMPHWRDWQIGKIDHLAIQEWITQLARELSPATVSSCHVLMSSIMASAVRSRVIAFNPCEGVRLPAQRKHGDSERLLSLDEFTHQLLPAIPDRHRALVAAAAGAGLRWGECLGLRWSAVDLDADVLAVVRVVIEVNGNTADKPYPKSAKSRRIVPLAPFLREQLLRLQDQRTGSDDERVLTNSQGRPMLRSNFRKQVWRPALVRAGLLGKVLELGHDAYQASWSDRGGQCHEARFTSVRGAIAHIAAKASGGMRFHDLRHCYATWLVSGGVSVNVVQAVMGHEQASTTLNRYTHTPADFFEAVREVFEGSS